MLVAILSYPKHYHVTQLAVARVLRFVPDVDKIAIIWDDTHDAIPNVPLHQLLREKFSLKHCFVIKWSSIIPNIDYNLSVTGAIGQQLIKLHLDTVLPDEEFIIFDGDTILSHGIDPKNILYSNRLDIRHSRFNHLNRVLGIENYEFWTNTFMHVKSSWLDSLRNHVLNVTGKSISYSFDYSTERHFQIYEWELIARYVLNILKVPKRIEYFDKSVVQAANFVKIFNSHRNLILDGADDMSIKFMEANNITVDRTLMQQLNYIHG